MILVNRFLTFVLPVLYLLFSLLWLIRPHFIYGTSAILILLLIYQVYLTLYRQFKLPTFIRELLKPLLFLIIAQVYMIFTPKNWEYVVLSLIFTVIIYYLLSDLFNRYNPYLIKLTLQRRVNLIYRLAAVFFMATIAYNFIVYLNWSLWLMLVISLLIMFGVMLITRDEKVTKNNLAWYFFVTVISAELMTVLYWLPSDIYLKSLIITLNFVYLTRYWQNRLKII
ncbi:MAG: hypothetical protein AUJ28_03605 [Parcubacteria group bacterium CG1_02_37_51]|uniref:Uncharacterized protein n=1 Tax=Candidatus Komeilibacteria bacterium CG_4_10_14_0_8_um_filter_37_78 TaxID=1974471 RepID=A0A2M7RDD6_9BACT|nr:MAG: hypothetical protein AUJ28_03605 [Parcubacteria group bacterium CG1_02_37_51]PIY94755.1 MAG: hypothetical protein COY67_02120 [Candidatus Komeilibacteria bacterium CG_4_10_14_0_8_um_filter_37_78]